MFIAVSSDSDSLTRCRDADVGARISRAHPAFAEPKDPITMSNFGDFQNEVYAEAVQGVTTRYPFDFASIERKASEALPD